MWKEKPEEPLMTEFHWGTVFFVCVFSCDSRGLVVLSLGKESRCLSEWTQRNLHDRKQMLLLFKIKVNVKLKFLWVTKGSAAWRRTGEWRYWRYEGVSKSFRTGYLEREQQMVQLCATKCSCIVVLFVSSSEFCRHNALCCFWTSNTYPHGAGYNLKSW